jgi:hypothetical protein
MERGEQRRQHGDDDGAWWHSSPSVAWTGSGGVRRSDSAGGRQPRQRTTVSGGWRWGGTEEQRQSCVHGGVGSSAALGPRAWHARTLGSFRHGAGRNGSRSGRVYSCTHGVGQCCPARPIGARHYATQMMTSGPRASVIFQFK